MFDRLRNSLARTFRGRSKASIETGLTASQALGSLTASAIGLRRQGWAETLLAYEHVPPLRRVQAAVSSSVAVLTWTLATLTKGPRTARRHPRMRQIQRSAALHGPDGRAALLRDAQMSGEVEVEYITEHPMLDVIHNGNGFLDGHSVWHLATTYFDLIGETHLLKERGADGLPVALWPIPPHWVQKLPTPARPYFELSIRGRRTDVPREDMISVRDPRPFDPYARGTGLAGCLGDELDSDEYAAMVIKAHLVNGAAPETVIGLPGAADKDVRQLQIDWDNKHRGPAKRGGTRFVNFEPKAVAMGHTFRELELIKHRRFVREIARTQYNVPPESVGETQDSNRATSRESKRIMAERVTVPRADRFMMALQTQLAPDYDDDLIVGYISPIPEDREHQLEVMKSAPKSTFSRGRWHQVAGLPSPDGQDVYPMDGGTWEHPVDAPPAQRPGSEDNTGKGAAGRKSARGLVTRQRPPTLEDVELVVAELQPDTIQARVTPIWSEEMRAFGDAALVDLGVDLAFDLLNPEVVDHLERFSATKIVGINDTTREALRATLVEGVKAGEGIDKLAPRVGAVFEDARGYRARTIARTEVMGSSNFATWQTHKMSDVVDQRQWIAALVDTRDAHAAMHEQVRGLREPFTAPDGQRAMYPGGFGVAELDINCMCVTIAVIGGESGAWMMQTRIGTILLTREVIRGAIEDYQQRIAQWLKLAESVFRDAFATQEAATLALLTSLTNRP